MTYRSYHPDLANALLNNDEYLVAHLVKFEKPTLNPNYNGVASKEAVTYSYITDAPFNIEFNDGSFSRLQEFQREKDIFENPNSLSGATPNGLQTYHANKLLSVGTLNEGIEAKASSLTIKLDSSSLGIVHFEKDMRFLADNTTIVLNTDISEIGFKEGDTVTLSAGSGSNNNITFIINRFFIDSVTYGTARPAIMVTQTKGAGSWTAETASYNMSLVSEELSTLVIGNGSTSYTNYINREVVIYRVFIDPNTNSIIGGFPAFINGVYDQKGAVLVFKGIISNAALNENPGKSSEMSWTLASHWGDFVRVQNRLTSDADHRAVGVNGLSDENMILRKEYEGDYGFEHSETSLNLIATYNRTETRTRLKKKKKALGLSKKYTQIEYEVEIPTDVELNINMQSKALPVVYGVQKIDSIPVFFDNFKEQPDRVYVAYALAEGTIGSLLDVSIDDKTTLCLDAADSLARSEQNENNSIDVLCKGRQDRGDVLLGTDASQGVGIYTHKTYNWNGYNSAQGGSLFKSAKNLGPIENTPYYTEETRMLDAGDVSTDVNNLFADIGIGHEQAYAFRDPIDCTLIFHQGNSNQRANNLLVEKADKQLFKVQNDFYSGNPHQYWTPNHRMLDTAYVVAEYLLSEGETNLPSLDFVVRGKSIDCHNYDGSFKQTQVTDHIVVNFNVGDTVTISGDGITTYTTTIIDRWYFKNEDNETEFRFRWKEEPAPIGGPTITMTKGTSVWNMQKANSLLYTGTIPGALEAEISSSTMGSEGVNITLQNLANGFNNAVSATDSVETIGSYQRPKSYFGVLSANVVGGNIYATGDLSYLSKSNLLFQTFNSSTNTIENIGGIPDPILPVDSDGTAVFEKIFLKNAIRFPSGTGVVIEGSTIILSRFNSDNVPYVQERKVIDWIADATNPTAIVDVAWDAGYHPSFGDKYQIRTPKDKRISINPAMQLLDYLTSIRYGKGLDLQEDIDIETFKSAAVACDTRSDVTMVIKNEGNIPVMGKEYHRRYAGHTHWRGEVSKIVPVGADYYAVTFTDCIGKIVEKAQDFKMYYDGTLIWIADALTGSTLVRLNGAGLIGSNFTPVNGTTGFSIEAVGHVAPALTVDTGEAGLSADGNPVVKNIDSQQGFTGSGYSLYDSDNIKYWRMVGWDSHAQRNVTRHQLNQVVSTTGTVFDNVNNMLRQFNGILRYSNGKYQLKVKSAAPALSVYEKLSNDDIIGSIKLSDKGSKKTFNSVSASIIDPQNGFETRSVSFFNSEYLNQDNNVPKKGSFSTPSITNYYNARVNIKQFLDESRNGLEIQFTARPSAALLMAGEVFALSYNRFGWTEKLWRITNLNFLNNGNVSITAEEHSDSAYFVPAPDESRPVVVASTGAVATGSAIPRSPHSLTATQSLDTAIRLNWQNSPSFREDTHSVEIFSNTYNKRSYGFTLTGGMSHGTVITFSPQGNGAGFQALKDEIATLQENMVVSGDITAVRDVPIAFAVPGVSYQIKVLGNTDWNAIAGTLSIQYEIGSIIVPIAGASLTGTGVLRSEEEEIRVTSVGLNLAGYPQIQLNTVVTYSPGGRIDVTAPKIATVSDATTYTDLVLEGTGSVTRYYWVRYKVIKSVLNNAGVLKKPVYSAFFPNNNTGGIDGTAESITNFKVRDINISLSAPTEFIYTTLGNTIATGYGSSCDITCIGINNTNTPEFQFETVDANGTVVSQAFSTTASYTYNAPVGVTRGDGFDLMPQSIVIKMRESTDDPLVYIEKEQTINFTAARLLGDGDPGDSVDIIFQRSATEPSKPAASVSTPSGWSTTVSGTTGTDVLWSSIGTKSGTDTNYTWQDVVRVEGTEGPQGAAVVELAIYERSPANTAPNTPTGGSFNFNTQSLTPPSNWYDGVPSGTGAVFVSTGYAVEGTPSATAATITWSSPQIAFQDGSNGTPGNDSIRVDLTNENHGIPLKTNGLRDFSGSGTDVYVYEGTSVLNYDPSPTANQVGYWGITSMVGNNLTLGAGTNPSDQGTFARVKDHTNISSDVADVTFTIDGKNSDGVAFTRIIKQSIQGLAGVQSVKLVANTLKYEFSETSVRTHPASGNLVLTAETTGIDHTSPTVKCRFTKHTGVVTTVLGSVTTAVTNSSALPVTFSDAPEYYRVQVKDGTTILAEDKILIPTLKPGQIISVVPTNNNHTFFGPSTGVITSNNFESKVDVTVDGTAYGYDGTAPYLNNTFRYGAFTNTDGRCSPDASPQGKLTILGTSNILDTPGDLTSTFTVPVISNESNQTLAILSFVLIKNIGRRAGQPLSFEYTGVSPFGSSDFASWKGTLTTQAAKDAVKRLFDTNVTSTLVAGDKLTIYDSTSTATRVYQGPDRYVSNEDGVTLGEWSSRVVEVFDGSVIVEGTLDASVLTTSQIFANLTTSGSLELLTGGQIYTTNKGNYGDTSDGIFLGHTGGKYKLDIGGSDEYIRFDGDNIDLKCKSFSLQSSSNAASSRLKIIDDRLEVYQGSTLRVRLGRL